MEQPEGKPPVFVIDGEEIPVIHIKDGEAKVDVVHTDDGETKLVDNTDPSNPEYYDVEITDEEQRKQKEAEEKSGPETDIKPVPTIPYDVENGWQPVFSEEEIIKFIDHTRIEITTVTKISTEVKVITDKDD